MWSGGEKGKWHLQLPVQKETKNTNIFRENFTHFLILLTYNITEKFTNFSMRKKIAIPMCKKWNRHSSFIVIPNESTLYSKVKVKIEDNMRSKIDKHAVSLLV